VNIKEFERHFSVLFQPEKEGELTAQESTLARCDLNLPFKNPTFDAFEPQLIRLFGKHNFQMRHVPFRGIYLFYKGGEAVSVVATPQPAGSMRISAVQIRGLEDKVE
jgi:hypothetical protein